MKILGFLYKNNAKTTFYDIDKFVDKKYFYTKKYLIILNAGVFFRKGKPFLVQ